MEKDAAALANELGYRELIDKFWKKQEYCIQRDI
jgi:hypothetical protein